MQIVWLHVLSTHIVPLCLHKLFAQFGNVPLHSACYNSHKEIVQLLLDKGADKDALDNVSMTRPPL